ncbi:MAG: DUF4870 domain-containing protein, partial [Vulcanimicrobiaceae bacterium]
MDCFFHDNVPSVTRCNDCSRAICATCRDERGLCPSCRLAERLDAANGARGELPGQVARRRTATPGNPAAAGGTAVAVSPETRALTALGYPLWPLAALALLDPKKSRYVRRQAVQALALNFGVYGLWIALTAIAQLPILGMSAFPLLALLVPVAFVASVVYGFKVWHGDDVRVPLVSDWLD